MNRALWVVIISVLAACAKKEAPAALDSTATSAPTAAPVAPSAIAEAPPVVDIDSLPVEEDFEAEAEKEITSANLSAKLDALDKEISAP